LPAEGSFVAVRGRPGFGVLAVTAAEAAPLAVFAGTTAALSVEGVVAPNEGRPGFHLSGFGLPLAGGATPRPGERQLLLGRRKGEAFRVEESAALPPGLEARAVGRGLLLAARRPLASAHRARACATADARVRVEASARCRPASMRALGPAPPGDRREAIRAVARRHEARGRWPGCPARRDLRPRHGRDRDRGDVPARGAARRRCTPETSCAAALARRGGAGRDGTAARPPGPTRCRPSRRERQWRLDAAASHCGRGWGFGNDAPTRFGPPRFEAASVSVAEGTATTRLRLAYPGGRADARAARKEKASLPPADPASLRRPCPFGSSERRRGSVTRSSNPSPRSLASTQAGQEDGAPADGTRPMTGGNAWTET
jgi:hypothetical protein